jgi:ornithine cyclodeaminase/alanine dehydrogenase-like protein (mu-crystallin family)
MEKIYSREQISEVIKKISVNEIIDSIEKGFVAYSQGKVVVPPVGELIFKDPPGESHIKYGYIMGDDYYVIKIAAGFYENSKLGLPTNSGLVLVFNQKTGQLVSVLLDEGDLTNIRTAAAGAVVARYLAPAEVNRIGIFGAGYQGKMQLEYLKPVVNCKDVTVWGLNLEELNEFKAAMSPHGFQIQTTMEAGQIAETCNLIVTATPSKVPLLKADQIRPGTHITAMGSDTSEKQELDSEILGKADLVVSDSIDQSRSRGEIYRARKAGMIDDDGIFELGTVIEGKAEQRTTDEQITVADLTGVAVQDIQICKMVSNAFS